jgi:hypothetical protein
VLVLCPSYAGKTEALASHPAGERKQGMSSKIVYTMVIDIDEDGVPLRRYTGPVPEMETPARDTFDFIRQRYKFAQVYALAKVERMHKHNSDPQTPAIHAPQEANNESVH